jgi:hypothetical protein
MLLPTHPPVVGCRQMDLDSEIPWQQLFFGSAEEDHSWAH